MKTVKSKKKCKQIEKFAFCKSKSVKLKEDQECKQTLPDFLTSVDFQLSKFKKSKQTFLSKLTKFKKSRENGEVKKSVNKLEICHFE